MPGSVGEGDGRTAVKGGGGFWAMYVRAAG